MVPTRSSLWLLFLLLSAACGATDSGRALTPAAPGPAAELTSNIPRRPRFRVVGSLSEALSPSRPAQAPYDRSLVRT